MRYRKSLIMLLLVIILFELILRFCFGFCDNVLIRESDYYEYIAQPNQQRFRFGNNIIYNSLSMRSDEPNENFDKIVFFGDSVINGGALTDNSELATTILSQRKENEKIQILNVSAGSWGPDNCFAYLENEIEFKPKKIVLVVSSHDAYDNMNFEKIVDKNVSFSSAQYSLAIYELLDRYLIPKFKNKIKSTLKEKEKEKEIDDLGINKKNKESGFNSGFLNFSNFCNKNEIDFFIILHAEKNELKDQNYNEQGQRIIEFCNSNHITLLKDIHTIRVNDYRDKIHLNANGQKKLVDLILSSKILH